jgi:hypothetical protein
MVNYELILNEAKVFVERICSYVENMNTNEDLKNILDISTTEWGLVKTLISHFDDPGAGLLGADLYARIVAAIAIAEAKD